MSLCALRSFVRGLLVVVAALAYAGGAVAAPLVEGKNYARIRNPQPVETGKKIEVIEFFSYGCPHCAELEPHLDAWLAKQPPDEISGHVALDDVAVHEPRMTALQSFGNAVLRLDRLEIRLVVHRGGESGLAQVAHPRVAAASGRTLVDRDPWEGLGAGATARPDYQGHQQRRAARQQRDPRPLDVHLIPLLWLPGW